MSVGLPPWLPQSAEVRALLGAALDRFDRQPGEERQRAVHLPAEKYLPSLKPADAEADLTWRLMGELERLGVLRIQRARHHPYDPDWTGARLAFSADSEPVLRAWLGRQRKEPAMEVWRRAVQARADAFPGGCEALAARRVEIEDRSCGEVVEAFARIAALRGPITLRRLSATVFWGDPKVLDARRELIEALFPQLPIRERTLPVSVFLPEQVHGVLFIENQDTYTAALAGFPESCGGLALVYASGFRGAARYIRSRGNVVLHYAGPGVAVWQERLERWWWEEHGDQALGPCAFWGDLDFAGMQILKALRGRFPQVAAWRPGYEPMLAALRARGGHQSTDAQGEAAQTDPQQTGCAFADEILLPAIRAHGQIDQEMVAGPDASSG
jgi:hypothetical protein